METASIPLDTPILVFLTQLTKELSAVQLAEKDKRIESLKTTIALKESQRDGAVVAKVKAEKRWNQIYKSLKARKPNPLGLG